MIIFDGDQLAAQLEAELKTQVEQLRQQGVELKIAALLFTEDDTSRLYAQLKQAAVERVGIDYELFEFSLAAGTSQIEKQIESLNQDLTVTGIMIQKPQRRIWSQVKGVDPRQGRKAVRQAFNAWWQFLTSRIELSKDVDGLHPQTLAAIQDNTWQKQGYVLPATAHAVLSILSAAFAELKLTPTQQKQQRILVLGRSDIVGQPVYYELLNQGFAVKMLTRDDVQRRLNSPQQLIDAEIIITATGHRHLITGEMVKDGVIIIDVGEPQPDLNFESVQSKAAFITPVPGGVGPMTVVSLLQNCLNLVAY